jgi:curved DNA binding protein
MAAAAADGDEPILGIEDAGALTKYKLAGDMASRVIKAVRAECVAGKKTIDICNLGDELILKEVAAVYNKKKDAVKKGIAMPTCLSVNNCICHNRPIASDKEIVLADGDVVKIDLAVHLDGYIAPVATTLVVGADEVTGRKADVIMAAHTAAEVALRMMRPGCKTYAVTDAITKVAEAFKCTAVEGFLSHQLTQNKIDGEKAVIQNPTPKLRKEHKDAEIKEHDVFAIDIIMSTGAGKTKESEQRTTIFRKLPDAIYQLKMKASRSFFSEVSKSFDVMPFCLGALSDEKTARLGVTECVKHDLVQPYKILLEEDGEFVAQVKILVLIMPNGNLRGTTDADFDVSAIKTEHKLEDEDLLALLKTQVGAKNKKKKKNKKKADDAGADAAASEKAE